jgi:radical SAM superfamily enzyme
VRRRICWPDPDAVCVAGGCTYCNDHLFVQAQVIVNWIERQPEPTRTRYRREWRYGYLRDFFNVETRW